MTSALQGPKVHLHLACPARYIKSIKKKQNKKKQTMRSYASVSFVAKKIQPKTKIRVDTHIHTYTHIYIDGKRTLIFEHTHIHSSNILADRCMCVSVSVSVCVCASVVGGCEIDHWIALGVWSSAGGVVGSPSTMPSSNAPFTCLLF